MKLAKLIALLLTLVMCFTLLAGCGSESASEAAVSTTSSDEASTEETSEKEEKADKEDEWTSVSVGSTGELVGLFYFGGDYGLQSSRAAQFLAFDKILFVDEDLNYYSDVLEDYYYDETENTYVFVLRDGVYFSSGDQMLAEDIQWTLQDAASGMMGGMYMFADYDNAIISDDGLTLTCPANYYSGKWMSVIVGATITNKSWIEEHGGPENMDLSDPELVDGSGPYRVVDYEEGISTTYQLRDDWWMRDEVGDTMCTVDELKLYQYSDATTMMIDYESGVLDIALRISETDYANALNDPYLGTAGATSANTVLTVHLDAENTPALADENLRKAICLGVNPEELNAASFKSLGTVADSFIASSVTNYYTPGYCYEYDPEAAAQIVEENGLTGTQLTFVCESAYSGIAEVLQYELSEIGIDLNVEIYDQAACQTYWMNPGGTAFLLDGSMNSSQTGDPADKFGGLASSSMFVAERITSEEFNTLLEAADNGKTTEERKENYDALQQYLIDNYLVIPVCEWHVPYIYGANGRVADFQIKDASYPDLRHITLAD